MTIKQKLASGGSISLVGTDSAADYTVTLPASNITVAGAGANTDITSLSGVTSINGGPLGGFRNRIIGGDFTVNPWQRGTSITGLGSGSSPYLADRFYTNNNTDGVISILKTADAPTVSQAGSYTGHCLHIDCTTADVSIATNQSTSILHAIEGYNAASFGFGQAGTRYVTLSFWVKSTKTGQFYATLSNSAGNRAYSAGYTVSASNTWEQKTLTVAVDTTGTWLYDNGSGLALRWWICANPSAPSTANTWGTLGGCPADQVNALDSTANDFKLALIQLEPGSTATTFEQRPYGVELALCQRYYYRVKASAANDRIALGQVQSTTIVEVFAQFPVTMRTAPTALETSGTATDYRFINAAGSSVVCSVSPNFAAANTNNATLAASVASGLVAGNATVMLANTGAAGYLGWSAEL